MKIEGSKQDTATDDERWLEEGARGLDKETWDNERKEEEGSRGSGNKTDGINEKGVIDKLLEYMQSSKEDMEENKKNLGYMAVNIAKLKKDMAENKKDLMEI